MKKNYILILFITLLSLGGFSQLSGVYTIDGASATAGTNYQTFQAAISALNTSGVSGAVTFNVAAGTYTGEVLVGSITGASATNTITFDGGTSGATITYAGTSSTRGTIRFLNASHTTFMNLNVTTTGYGRTIYFDGNNNYITLKKCNISTKIGTSSAFCAIYNESGTSNKSQFITIDSNNIVGGYYGIYFYGGSSTEANHEDGNVITNNDISDFYYYGAYLYYQKNINFSNNTVKNGNSSTSVYGVYLRYGFYNKAENNKITLKGSSTIYGIYNYYQYASATTNASQSNNMISVESTGTGTIYGIYLYYSRYFNLYHNTVNTIGGGTNTWPLYSYFSNSTNYRDVNIENNIFVNSGTGRAAYYYNRYNKITAINNNLYNSSHPTPIYYYGTTGVYHPTLVAFQTAAAPLGANGVFGDPQFYSSTDLHVYGTLASNTGLNKATITSDIDGDVRPLAPSSTVDIGADEYNVPTCPPVTGLTAFNRQPTAHDITWTPGGSDVSWQIEYGPTGFTQGTGTVQNSANDTATISGLANQTNYQAYVRGICGPADTGVWIGPVDFRTFCSFQFNGTYTIDPATAVSATNYHSISTFLQEIQDCGVSGPVTLNVVPGSGPYVIYEDVMAIPGASATNTITLNGNGDTINRTNSSETYFIAFNGAKHITVNNFHFINNVNSNILAIVMRNKCDSLTFTNNLLNLRTNLTSSLNSGICGTSLLTSPTASGENANNITVDGNTIIGGYYGVTTYGLNTTTKGTGWTISNNTFEDQYAYGISTYYSDDNIIHNNDISRPNRTNSVFTFYGIRSYYSVNTQITHNRIHNLGSMTRGLYGIYFGQSTNTAAKRSNVINNAIYDVNPTSTTYALYLNSTMSYVNVFHNTVTINTDGNTSNVRAIYRSSSPNNEEYRNNIVDVTGSGTGTKYCIYVSNATSLTNDYNLFHMGASGGTNYLGYSSGNRVDLAAWRTATSGGANSTDFNPVFTAGTIIPLSSSIDNIGDPIAAVTIDIDSITRNATTPDMGAIEFTATGGDLKLVDISLEQVDDCYGIADSAIAILENQFGDTIDFTVTPVKIYYGITGPIPAIDSIVIAAGKLAAGNQMKVYNFNVNMSMVGVYTISGFITPASYNILTSNDSLLNHATSEVKKIVDATPAYDTIYSFTDSSKLKVKSPFINGTTFFISEVCQYAGASNGRPTGGKPTWMKTDDYIEVTGVPGSDLAGFTFEQWNSGTTATRQSTHTFPSGTVLGPNGTAIIATSQISGQTNDPANFIYLGNGSFTGTNGSGGRIGKVLKDPSGNVIDAVAYNGSTTTAYIFPTASGVTASDWSMPLLHTSGTWGIRLTGPDNNTGSNWVISTGPKQDPNVLNSGVPVPAAGPVPGLTWTDLATTTVIDSTDEITVKGFTSNGTYAYEASYTTPCGVFKDTSWVTVLNITYDTVDQNSCDTVTSPISGRKYFSTGLYNDTIFGASPIYDSIVRTYNVSIDTTSEIFTITNCGNFYSPSGKTWTTSGTYLDTITNSLGCDSLMTFNLTVTAEITIPLVVTSCDTYTWRGRSYTASTMDRDTVNNGSCDSIFTLDLTVNYKSFDTVTVTVCDSLVSPSGKSWTTTGTYMDTIPNAIGCDSIMTYNLTVDYISYRTLNVTVCDSFVSPNGKVWTTTGVYNDTVMNALGCDSALTYNLTVNYSSIRTDNIVLCPGGNHRVGPSLYTTAGTYTNVFRSFFGCDSTIITNLSFHPAAVATVNYNFCTGDSVQVLGNWYYTATVVMDTIVGGSSNGCDSVTTHNITTRTVTPALNLGNDVVACLDGGVTIFASTAYDTYNWSSGGTTNVLSVTGATAGVSSTDHILTVTQASSGCTARDTVNITFNNCTGLGEIDADLNVNLFPNPATDFVTIEIIDKYNQGNLKLEILNSIGQVVASKSIENSNEKVIMDVNNFSKGIYLVRVSSDRIYMTKKLIIQK